MIAIDLKDAFNPNDGHRLLLQELGRHRTHPENSPALQGSIPDQTTANESLLRVIAIAAQHVSLSRV